MDHCYRLRSNKIKNQDSFDGKWEYAPDPGIKESSDERLDAELSAKIKPTKRENIMIMITNPTLINNRDVEDMSENTLINFIKEEESAIKILEEVEAKSEKISKMIKQRQKTISKLVKILDAR